MIDGITISTEEDSVGGRRPLAEELEDERKTAEGQDRPFSDIFCPSDQSYQTIEADASCIDYSRQCMLDQSHYSSAACR